MLRVVCRAETKS